MKIYRLNTRPQGEWLLSTQATAVRYAKTLGVGTTLHCVDFMGSTRQRRGVVEALNTGLMTLDWERLLPDGRSSGYYILPAGEGEYLGYRWRSGWRRQGIIPQFHTAHAPGAAGEYRYVIWAIYEIPLRRSRPQRFSAMIESIDEPAGLPPPPYRRRLTTPSAVSSSEGRRDVAR